MFEDIELLFKKLNIHVHQNQGITVANVADVQKGIDLAESVLYEVVDRKTVLYLSGGSLKSLYEKLAKEEILSAGAIGQIDERYGTPMHGNSNQLMIVNTGLAKYAQYTGIPVYWLLQSGKSREETAQLYDEKIRELNSVYPKSIGLLGIGPDGHTAGLPAQNFQFLHSASSGQAISNFKLNNHDLVTEYNDTKGKYKERVTMTFLGLEMLDLLIVLAFGSAKQTALDLIFNEGSEALRQAQGEREIPARFFKRPEIAKKTLLITDLSV